MRFYTNIARKWDKLLVRGYEDGRPFSEEINYEPYLFVETDKETGYKTIHGENVRRIDFHSMSSANDFIKKNSGMRKVYGLTDFAYVYLYDTYKENFEYNFSWIKVVSLDIENDSSNGFANIEKADKEITAITLTNNGKSISFGYFDYPSVEGRVYYKCENESYLLKKFIQIWNSKEWLPDVVTGWNIEFFDIPYLVNRIKLILGDEWVKRLSPFRLVKPKSVILKNGKEFTTYDLSGISSIDYLAAYKKFSMGERESYKLDSIANHELNEQKLDYTEYKTLDGLYRQNFHKFMDYNIYDSFLVDKLEAKLHFIEQMISIAYVQRVNYEDTITTVKPWDVIIHNYLMDQNVVIPPKEMNDDGKTVIGGYVKEPKPGLYEWVCSVDFTSLYPSLAMQYNISPDTFVKKWDLKPSLEQIMFGNIDEVTKRLKTADLCMSPNGVLYNRKIRGFFPSILKKFFDGRKIYKKEMINAKQELQLIEDEMKRRGIKIDK